MEDKKEIVYVKEVKPNKMFQYSKIVTTILLAIGITTWGIGVYGFFVEVVTFGELSEFTIALATLLLPYFCLAFSDRIKYAVESFAKFFGRKNESEEIV